MYLESFIGGVIVFLGISFRHHTELLHESSRIFAVVGRLTTLRSVLIPLIK